ncbi:MAG: glycosyltransferase family 4 protein [Paludibacteraceae bacterium]|nr:glycosyltransferase family 4 protein [Paludibacteraceae bacterium]
MKGKIAFVGNSARTMMNFRMGVMKALTEDNYEVVMIAPQDCDMSPLQGSGIRFIAIKIDCKGMNPWRDIHLILDLKNIYRSEHFDFIFHFTIKAVIYGSMAAALCHIKHISVVTGLGYTFIKRNWLFLISRALHRVALRKAEAVWFLNQDDCDCFVSLKIVPSKKVHVIHGEGVDTSFFATDKPLPEPFTFIYIGRMLRYKGVELFVRAAEILRKEYPRVRWQLLGPLDNDDLDCITAGEIEEWVQHGFVEYLGVAKDVRPYIEQASCAVLPSYFREGVPRSLLESASMERIILTTNSVGCKEVVQNGVNGLVCEMNSLDSLVEAMRKIVEMPSSQLQQMGQNGRKYVLHLFDEKIIIAEYQKALQKYLNKETK